jgi:hypothetical protein
MRLLILLGLLIMNKGCLRQEPVDVLLKAKLKIVLRNDQIIREFFDSETSEIRKDSICKIMNYPKEVLEKTGWHIMEKLDSENLNIVEDIILKYGYPGKTLVGSPENTAVFYVIQHSKKIPKYYPLIKKAGEDNELPFMFVAMMLDRLLTNQSKEQVYGTQVSTKYITNPKTGQKEEFSYVIPIKDPGHVNQRRKEAGFKTTVEENAAKLGVRYKVYTYKQLKQIMGDKV